jgi:hypothetical protein
VAKDLHLHPHRIPSLRNLQRINPPRNTLINTTRQTAITTRLESTSPFTFLGALYPNPLLDVVIEGVIVTDTEAEELDFGEVLPVGVFDEDAPNESDEVGVGLGVGVCVGVIEGV